MTLPSVLEIVDYGAWHGGTPVDNSAYENMGMSFKGNIPVNSETIEARIGVRSRMAASPDERIGVIAFQDLIDKARFDPSRIKLLIGATNVGEDKYDPGPLVMHSLELIREKSPDATALDLYAGCPGFNVSLELAFMLSLSGILREGDISVIVGAENIHRAKPFPELDTSNIIFGDDAMATALETKATVIPSGEYSCADRINRSLSDDFVTDIAECIAELNGHNRLDGIIIDNQMGTLLNRVPATAARVQHKMVELLFSGETEKGIFDKFPHALGFYDNEVNSFAYDIMTFGESSEIVNMLSRAYVESGKYKAVASVFLTRDLNAEVSIHRGEGFTFNQPQKGIVDTVTSTHGCFANFIQALLIDGDVFGDMDGKGVFLYATRGASSHLEKLLVPNKLALDDIDLLIEHQANFAMIPMTLEQLLKDQPEPKKAARDFIADKTVINIHNRANCSVVCMQRLPYDLQRGALQEDTVQGYPVNRNLERLREAKIIVNDSVGAGMTRSSVLQLK